MVTLFVDCIQILETVSHTLFKILDKNVLPNKELLIRIGITNSSNPLRNSQPK